MKRKIIILLLVVMASSACSNVSRLDMENVLSLAMDSKSDVTNISRAGYRYYLPKGMRIVRHVGNNEILVVRNNSYYLYVDSVSCYHKVKNNYQVKNDVYYSKSLGDDDLFGYIEVKTTSNDKYYLEIMYNYAKIEVMVDKEYLNEAILYSMSILTSVDYQDVVLRSFMEDDVLASNEVEHNIFETADTESDYLQVLETYEQYEEKDESVDPDFIRR